MSVVLGIDTSCYYTSAALVKEGKVLFDIRRQLTVEQGERGLRQADAVFEHIKALPEIIEQIRPVTGEYGLTAVCVSGRPRNLQGSYMPVFLAGQGVARAAAAAAGVPVFISDHQSGHIAAGLWSCGYSPKDRFLALHLSGGTTELLAVKPDTFESELLGATADLHAGQLIDRVGVALGFPFPSGKFIDEMAVECRGQDLGFATSVKGERCSFSGIENAALGLIEKEDKDIIALSVMSAITRTLDKLLHNCSECTGIVDILLTGGVAASAFLRQNLPQRMQKRGHHVRLFFGKQEYCGDNAVGIALIGERKLKGGSSI